MDANVTMQTSAARLASFEVAHPATKKRTSSTKGAKALRWPHKTPSPAQLAEAGFFFRPTSSTPDNAACFLCRRDVDGWEADDDPAVEHLKLSPDCGWAINVCINQRLEAETREDEDPTSEKMSEARKMTFGSRWPHENKRGWFCKTQRMVEAGWYYCPNEESDDYVKCPYCNLAIDGWEPKDNPYHEHQRRSADCRFFSQRVPKVKSGRGHKARTSKVSRLSTQSSLNTAMENVKIGDPGGNDDESVMLLENDSIIPSATSRETTKVTGAKKTTAKPRGKAGKTRAEDSIQASSYLEPEDDDFEVKLAPLPSKAIKGRKRKSEDMHEASNATNLGDTEELSQKSPAKRRATRTRASTAQAETVLPAAIFEGDVDMQMIESENMPPPSAPASKKTGKAVRKRVSSAVRKASAASTASMASLRVTVPNDEDIEAALEADLDRPLTDEEPDAEPLTITSSKTRRLTRTKPPSRNITASVAPTRRMTQTSTVPGNMVQEPETDADPQPEPVPQKPKGLKSRKASKKHLDAAVVDANKVQELQNPVHSSEVNVGQAAKPKQTKSRQTSRQVAARKTRASEDHVAHIVEYPIHDINSSALGSRTANDDSGHETDASVAHQTSQKRGPKKGTTMMTGKKTGMMSQKIQDIVQPEADREIPDEQAPVGAVITGEPEVVEPQGSEAAPSVKAISKKNAKSRTKTAKAKVVVAKSSSPVPMADEPWTYEQLCESTPLPPAGANAPTRSPAQSVPAPPVLATDVVKASPKEPSPQRTPQPIVSPQSSDAENQPPSSRPSALRPPLIMQSPSRAQTIRIPLAASTPTQSPSRRNISKLQTSMPWAAVDFEKFFLASPNVDKENTAKALKGALKSPEKNLTLEEWIYHNARKGEEELRNECERLVGRFEGEGVRALKSLEGIRCSD